MSEPISHKNKFLIVVAGPTGIGKSSLVFKLASKYGAEIFSADSRQIYKEMTIGTAKPSTSELDAIKHHFIDEIGITQSYSVGNYVAEFHVRLTEYFKSHHIAFVVGGTGLYINAVLEGLDYFPDIPAHVTDMLNESYKQGGLSFLQAELAKLDPEYYNQIDIHNPRRILRALQVIYTTGQTFTSYLGKITDEEKSYDVIPILLDMPRALLYDKINKRVDQMIKDGLIVEAERLYKFKDLRALQTVGYSELFNYFDGKYDLRMAIEMIKQNSRRYAKRQMTWFKKYGNWNTFDADNLNEIEQFIIDKMKRS